jgi:hypothetical protein
MIKCAWKSVLMTVMINLLPVTGFADSIDPTKPPDLTQAGGFILSAIMISQDSKLAVINGTIVHEGDTIGGMKVTSIGTNSVDLVSAQEKLNLVLLTGSVKSGNY